MEALEFLKEYWRMCKSRDGCKGCPLKDEHCLATGIRIKTDSEFLTIISVVEQWSKEHPIITNAQKFKEAFGEKRLSDLIDCKIRNALGEEIIVDIQKTEWWDEPYKEPEHEL